MGHQSGKGPDSPFAAENEVRIRLVNPGDTDAIRHVFQDAFESQGEEISRLSIDLLSDETGRPSFGLIGESEGDTVGCVIFSGAHISGCDHITASILAPLAVVRRRQRKGIGRTLIESGIRHLGERGTDLVFVLGDPAYYGRHGFGARHQIQAPYELPYPEAWMVRELNPGAIESAKGRFSCARTLMAPEHW